MIASMMLSPAAMVIGFSLSLPAFSVNVLQASQSAESTGTEPRPARLLLPSIFTSLSINVSSPSNVLKTRCDGNHYGRGSNVASCRDVYHFMARNDSQFIFRSVILECRMTFLCRGE